MHRWKLFTCPPFVNDNHLRLLSSMSTQLNIFSNELSKKKNDNSVGALICSNYFSKSNISTIPFDLFSEENHQVVFNMYPVCFHVTLCLKMHI